MTQREKVEKRIEAVGYVDNFWEIKNFILRLGAIICVLRKEGMNLSGAYGSELGKPRKFKMNYYYHKQ